MHKRELRYPWRWYFWSAGLAVLVLLAIVTALSLLVNLRQEQRLQQQQHDYFLSRLNHSIHTTLDSVELDVSRLAYSPLLYNYLEQPDTIWLKLLQQSYLSLARLRPEYDQIRFLDRHGTEIVRINRLMGGDAYVVPDEGLQNKSHRYYVAEALRLDAGELYLSPLDLNVERHEVEVPYKPMLRLSMPVYQQDQLQGLIVINYQGQTLLDNLSEVLPAPLSPLLWDESGHWLHGSDGRDWQFMFAEHTGLAVEMPTQWQQMQTRQRGEVAAGDECYVYQWAEYGQSHLHGPRLLLGLKAGQRCSALESRYLERGIQLMAAGSGVGLLVLWGWYRLRRRQWHLDQRIRRSEHKLRLITNEVGSGLIMVDRNGCVCWLNPEAERLLGWTEAELLGQELHPTIHMTLSGQVLHEHACPTLEALRTGERQHAERDFFRTREGHILPVHTTVTPLPGDGADGGAVITFSDDSGHLATENRLREQAMTDELTGCLNRRATMQLLDRLLEAPDSYPGVVLFDIDHFKRVNDRYGHAAGDQVLAYYAQEVRELLRAGDGFGRIGGEEFLIVFDNVSLDNLLQLAERVRNRFDERRCPVDEHRLHVTASFGVAVRQPGESSRTLMARADMALYRAKDQGRNRVEQANEELLETG
ncbi:GGDEF domain-containing protein [Marinobacterium marinum]|uniref:diguanylate cyclase n=1 Tax=Marinobacterium marinum TaxID=2756129 RepID=A0A7W1X0Z1_9GAMM|nr:sensor domain-containing diguanylate cyclase [Marinobacterium marinum]MBA4503736.1 diguanylate cyclase [Marinobacterium marinum]